MERLCLRHVMEEEQVLSDKTETELKVNLQLTGYKNDMEKNVTLDMQKKPNDV